MMMWCEPTMAVVIRASPENLHDFRLENPAIDTKTPQLPENSARWRSFHSLDYLCLSSHLSEPGAIRGIHRTCIGEKQSSMLIVCIKMTAGSIRSRRQGIAKASGKMTREFRYEEENGTARTDVDSSQEIHASEHHHRATMVQRQIRWYGAQSGAFGANSNQWRNRSQDNKRNTWRRLQEPGGCWHPSRCAQCRRSRCLNHPGQNQWCDDPANRRHGRKGSRGRRVAIHHLPQYQLAR